MNKASRFVSFYGDRSRGRIPLPTERQLSWKYLQDYLVDGLVNVQAYSNVKKIVDNSCIGWTEV